ncbi:MAG: acyltransferase [Barnesiella sp.]|jgi:brp/blh family beta-carotene 15,15'-monooxygenase|uniref:acyltransferase n=1 Tax=Barnesiella propionica TaxID=2981781 RepID=UPI0011CC20F6|nr:acyltransferase [Barnesiella propionica]MBO1736219.1 acyltransferase [Barnesiella sp. GGCC_0306]MBS7040625.1 acyltransferase [Bacteroidales bacterium]MCU6768453.1 acyltransferase [Barnesiella propionica]
MKREPNFEILRTLAMLFIVIGHFIIHGITFVSNHQATFVNMSSAWGISNFVILEYLVYITGTGVNCFVMISGYFLVKSEFRMNKILKIWIQTFFYSFFICLLIKLSGLLPLGFKDLVQSALPIHSDAYWFVSKYLGLLILSPFLAKLALALEKKKFQYFLLALFVLNVSLNKGFPYGDIYSGSYSLLWFIFLFYVAAYIRLYSPFEKFKYSFGKIFLLFCFFLAVCYLAKAGISYLRYGQLPVYGKTDYNGYTFFSAVLLFLWTKYHTFGKKTIYRLMVKIAPYAFGIYLIHDNRYIRELLWEHWIKPTRYLDSGYLLPVLFLSVILIYGICTGIDYFRAKLFTYIHINKLADHAIVYAGNVFNKIRR